MRAKAILKIFRVFTEVWFRQKNASTLSNAISHTNCPIFPSKKVGGAGKGTVVVQPRFAESRQEQPERQNCFLFPRSAFIRGETKQSGKGVYILDCGPGRG